MAWADINKPTRPQQFMIPVVDKEATGKPERTGGFIMFGKKFDETLKAYTFIAAAPVEACIIGDGKNPIPPEQATSVFQKAKTGKGQGVLIALVDDDDGEGPQAVVASLREFEVLRLTSPRLKLSPGARSSSLSSTEQADSLVALKKYQAARVLALQGSRKRVASPPAEGASSDTALDVAEPATGRAGAAKISSTKRSAAAAAAIATSVAAAGAGGKKPKRSFLQEIKSIPGLCRNRFIRKISPEIIEGAYSELKGKGKVQLEPKSMTDMRALVAELMGYEAKEVPPHLHKHPPSAAAASAPPLPPAAAVPDRFAELEARFAAEKAEMTRHYREELAKQTRSPPPPPPASDVSIYQQPHSGAPADLFAQLAQSFASSGGNVTIIAPGAFTGATVYMSEMRAPAPAQHQQHAAPPPPHHGYAALQPGHAHQAFPPGHAHQGPQPPPPQQTPHHASHNQSTYGSYHY
jgi:hypothetical protein